MRKNPFTGCRAIWIIVWIGAMAWAAASRADGDEDVARIRAQAERNRKVDHAALATQNEAIASYRALLKDFKGTAREPLILYQIAEAEREGAALEYRLAYAGGKAEPDLTAYRDRLQEVVRLTTTLLKRFTGFENRENVFLMRAGANAELKHDAAAKRDYEYLVANFPASAVAVERAHLALADYATENGDSARAIAHLIRIEANPQSPRYPFALRKLAWAFYNREDVASAVGYLTRHVRYYDDKKEASPDGLSSSESAFREASLLDTATFWASGVQKHLIGFEIGEALAAFRRLEPGKSLGKMALGFAKLLRVRGLTEELVRWNAALIEEEPVRPETLDVFRVTFEYLLEKGEWDRVPAVTAGLERLDHATQGRVRHDESYPAARKLMLSGAGRLQKAAAGETETPGAATRALLAVYHAYLNTAEPQDSGADQVRFNLAETLFRLGQFDSATAEYRTLLASSKPPRLSLMLKAINARYRALCDRKTIPASLTPAKLKGPDVIDRSDFDEPFLEWTDWLAEYDRSKADSDAPVDDFLFERARAIYARGQTKAAANELTELLARHPRAKFSVAAASLVLDTYVLSQDWPQIVKLTERFSGLPGLGDRKFSGMLNDQATDAAYKLVEAAYRKKDWNDTLAQADRFLARYSGSGRTADALWLASQAAGEAAQSERSERYLDRLISTFPDAPRRSPALLARASLKEDRYDFAGAAQDYEAYLATGTQTETETPREEVARRTYRLHWLAKIPGPIDCGRPGLSEKTQAECDGYRALNALRRPPEESDRAEATAKAKNGFEKNRPLWAAVTLAPAAGLANGERQAMIRTLAEGWGDLDRLTKIATVSVLMQRLPAALRLAREDLSREAPLKVSKAAISARIGSIQNLEKTAQSVIRLPWAYLRVSALAELSGAYRAFAEEVRALPAPKGASEEALAEYRRNVEGIVRPLAEKADRLLTQARDVGAELAVDAREIAGLSPRSPTGDLPSAEPIDASLLGKLDTDAKLTTGSRHLIDAWREAVEARAWGTAAFLLQELKRKESPSETTTSLMQAIVLYAAGAQAEALTALESVMPKLGLGERKKLREILYAQYARTLASKKAEAMRAEKEEGRGT